MRSCCWFAEQEGKHSALCPLQPPQTQAELNAAVRLLQLACALIKLWGVTRQSLEAYDMCYKTAKLFGGSMGYNVSGCCHTNLHKEYFTVGKYYGFTLSRFTSLAIQPKLA